jgi:hypothetical protein
MRWLLLVAVVFVPLASTAGAEPGGDHHSGALITTVGYVPSRVMDLLDIVRLRARVGPGLALGVRATEVADVFLGSYASVYAGLPGPRGRVLPRLPVGIESRAGAEVGPADLSTGLGFAPTYPFTECGIGLQLFLVGIDVGVDPVELIDFATGFLLLDLRDDDI